MGLKRRTGYLFKRGENYYVAWVVSGKKLTKALRDDNGQPITERRKAEEARDAFMAPMAVADEAAVLSAMAERLDDRKTELAKWEEQQNPPLAISEAWREFLASPNRPDSGAETLYQYECQWKAFADWMNDHHKNITTIKGVTSEIAAAYASHLNHGWLAPSTYNKHLNLLTLVLNTVREKGRITDNVFAKIHRKLLATQSRRELTVEELRKVCQSASGEMRTLFALGVYSGLRLGDAVTLRWGEVDLRRGSITRIPSKTARRNPKPVIIPIHPALAEILNEISKSSNRGEYLMPELANLYLKRNDLVTDRIQAHFKANAIRTWKPGTGTAGKRAVIEVGFHSLRHSFVSLCREANAPLAVVEAIVGHSNPAITRHYTHLGELAAQKVVALLPSVMSNTETPKQEDPVILLLRELMAGLQSMATVNWTKKRDELIALIAAHCPIAPKISVDRKKAKK